jgi:hypothetical protein
MERIAPRDVDQMLRQYLGRRSDLGLWNALTAQVFEPQNPFEGSSRKKLQRWFVLFVVSSTAAVAAIVYFNFLN